MNKKSGQRVKTGDRALEFENFLRFALPDLMNLTPSKKVSMEIVFTRFADYARAIMEKSPRESKIFLEEFIKRAMRVSKFRAPKGHKVALDLKELKKGKAKYNLIAYPNSFQK